jgi:uncharacterized protein
MITTDQINLLKDVIVETMQPERIYLFGSYAYGVPNEHSDLDILIEVKNSDLPKSKRNLEISYMMSKNQQLHFPKDIFVFTSKEMNDWKDLKNSFINNALYQSKTLYERN